MSAQYITQKENLINSFQTSDDSVRSYDITPQVTDQRLLSSMASSVHKTVVPFDEGK